MFKKQMKPSMVAQKDSTRTQKMELIRQRKQEHCRLYKKVITQKYSKT